MAKKAPRGPRQVEVKPDAAWTPPALRPIALTSLLGQERAVERLRQAVAGERLHHSWLFHGPVGVGKFTAALAFATELLRPRTGGMPEIAASLAAGAHPDLHVVTKELASISREEKIRPSKQRNIALAVLQEFATEPAVRTRVITSDSIAAKVFIIDEADLMEDPGQNHVLKTLEEPPPGTVFILVTPSLEDLLPTVRSHSQPVAFAPLTTGEMEKWLKGRAEVGGLAAADREFLVRFADGSPGVAEAALRTGIITWARELEPLLAGADRGRYSSRLGPAMAGFVDDWAAARVSENKRASKDAANKAAASWMFRYLAGRYRRMLHDGAAAGNGALERASRAIALIQDAERQTHQAVQLQFVLENLSAQLSAEAVTPRR